MPSTPGFGQAPFGMSGSNFGQGYKRETPKIILDERYFRKLSVYDGSPEKFRGWVFQLTSSIGCVDGSLAKEVRELLSRGLDDSWDPKEDNEIDEYLYHQYREELFGVLVQNTSLDAQSIVRGIWDKGFGEDGFKAISDLSHRFDQLTAASLLQAYMEVIKPPQITKLQEI